MVRGEPQWQPISRLDFLTDHIREGVRLGREHLDLLSEAKGAYRLSNADVDGIIRTWTKTKDDLVHLYGPQAERWQANGLGAMRRRQVEAYAALVAENLALVEQTLALADELKAWTIEALMAKSDEQVGLEALLGRQL